MAAQTILVIDAHGLQAWQRRARKIERGARFDGFGDSSAAQFRTWLQSGARDSHYTVLADLAEERFALERLPRAGRADTQAMIARKLGQHFPDTRFTTSLALGRHEGASALNRVLLGALTRPALLTPWLGALEAAGAVVTRLTSTPLLLDQWNRRRLRQAGQFVLLMLTASGMRLTLFNQGRLRFSRLVPARGSSLADCESSYRAELAQTRAYLGAQHLIDHDTALKVTVLAHHADHALLRTIVDAGTGLAAEFVDLHHHLRRQPRTDPSADSDATALILQQLVHSPPAAHYTPRALHRAHTLKRARAAMIGTAALTSTLCAIAAGARLAELDRLDADIDAVRLEQLALTRTIDTLIDERPSLPVPAPQLENWLSALEHQRAQGIALSPVLQRISAVLETLPSIQLDRLRWRRAVLPGDAVLLPSGPSGADPAFVVVDGEFSLASDPAHAPHEASLHSAAVVEHLHQELGPQAQVRHLPARPDSNLMRAADGPHPGSAQMRTRLGVRVGVRFALPITPRTEH